jgi:hypothetical protein
MCWSMVVAAWTENRPLAGLRTGAHKFVITASHRRSSLHVLHCVVGLHLHQRDGILYLVFLAQTVGEIPTAPKSFYK